MRRRLAVLVAVTAAAAACTPGGDATTTTSTTPASTSTTVAPEPFDPNGFYLVLMWHQHQPLYPKDGDGVVTRPWVRLHAAKDYVDMVTTVAAHPDVHVTFNLTPVLLIQLQELMDGTRDTYWTHTETPAAELSDEERAFIRDRFFDTNPAVIARFPRYQELADLRAAAIEFTTDDYRDLQVLFNLAWTDPGFLADEPLAGLVAKGRGYAEEDKATVLDAHLQIARQVFSAHRRLWDAGQIEVTTTPLAHPILPLLGDTNEALAGDPTAQMPQSRFRSLIDAREQVATGLDLAEELLGRRPEGMWPGEGSVSQLVSPLFPAEGVRWIATGEHVLGQTLGSGDFTRDASGTVEDAATLYRVYAAEHDRNDDLPVFFRDVQLSDLLAFEYSGMSAGAAADDFMGRLQAIDERLDTQGVTGPRVVSVILDGENAWEHYENDGKDFLDALYGRLSEADWLRTVTPGELLAAFPDLAEPLPDLFPASWFQPNFATWIGEPEEADAWDYLAATRSFLDEAARSGDHPAEAITAAFRPMFFAQGSDWFWWYGTDQDSGDDGYFDGAYRELLGQVYDALGTARPGFVRVPIIPEDPAEPVATPADLATITIDNAVSDDEWAAAGRYDLGGSGTAAALRWTFDKENLYLRIDEPGAEALDLYLGVPSAPVTRGLTLDGRVLGFGASHLLSWSAVAPGDVDGPAALPPVGTGDGVVPAEDRPAAGEPLPAGFDGSAIEVAVPLASLGAIDVGDRMRMRLVDPAAAEEGLGPAAGPMEIQVPDVSDVAVSLALTDPEGDDDGPGTYTYPTDPVFAPGVYDLTEFTVGETEDELVFTFDVLGSVDNPWGSPNGVSVQTFDVYIDTDPATASGARKLIAGRNAALEAGSGWEYGLTIEGWEPALFVADADGGVEETFPTFTVLTFPDRGRVVARLPRALFPDGDPAGWGYAVAVLSQEGFPSAGVRRVRDVTATAQQYRIGGGTGAINETRILDVLLPGGDQADWLGAYEPITTGSVDDLEAEDFPKVPLVVAG